MEMTVAVTGLNRGENPQPGAAIIQSLRRRYPKMSIVGLVYDILESGIYQQDCADLVFQLPFPSEGSDSLLSRLDYILAQKPIDILIPALDAELHGLIQLERQLAERGVRMMLPSLASYKACRKSELMELARASRCRTPNSLSAVDIPGLRKAALEIGYPLMVKGPYYGAYQVSTEAELELRFHEIIASWGGPVVLQQLIAGSELNVIAVGDGEGGVSGFCAIRKTIITEKGKGFGGITVRDARLNEAAMAVIKQLKWHGPIELEYIKNETNGEFYLIEINPRFPAWVDFPSNFGHNMPALVIESITKGRMTTLPDYPAGKFFVRHSVDLMGDVGQMGELSTHGELHFPSRCDVAQSMPIGTTTDIDAAVMPTNTFAHEE